MKRQSKFLIWTMSVPVLMFGYMNCGEFNSGQSDLASVSLIQSAPEQQNVTVQSAEQIARSMASVTGVEFVSSILNEFNSRKSLMTTDYSLESVNAPMMISIANLGSRYCEELIKVESAKPAAERKFFTSVDFGKGVANLSDPTFDELLKTFAFKFWGRELSAEERTILNDTKREFIQAMPANSSTSTSQMRLLLMSTCSAMLASMDFILI